MCNLFEPGRYACICCGTELFDSEEKFQSGTGWPSFTQPIKTNAIAYHKDKGFGMYRIENRCNTCDRSFRSRFCKTVHLQVDYGSV